MENKIYLKVTGVFLLILFSIFVGVLNSQAVFLGEQAVEQSTEPAEYEPDVILVKFKDEVDKEKLLEGPLRDLQRDFSIESIEPVFKHLHTKMAETGKTEDELIEETKERFALRTQRAPFKGKQRLDPGFRKVFKIKLKQGSDIFRAISQLKESFFIAWAEPDYIARSETTPNDPYFSSMWGLHRIHMQEAWDLNKGDSAIVVAVIDSGVDYEHPDIITNMWDNGYGSHGYDAVNSDYFPMDDFGHGTHVAGTIAAATNNSLGVAGVSWYTKIMAVKGLNSLGSGNNSDLADCIYYAADNGADILSNSWGTSIDNEILREAFDYAYQSGVVSVASAGNDNMDASNHYPSAYPHVICVAAWNYNDTRASFSNWGDSIDVTAPGVDILSLRAGKGNYIVYSGTSMAAPHVSGVASLILSMAPEFTNDLVEEIIQFSAQDVLAIAKDKYTGYGLLDAQEALELTDEMIIPPEPPGYIQTLINGAKNGEVILIPKGIYAENLDFKGKNITLKSEKGPDMTILDGRQNGPVVMIQSGNGTLDGFTIQNGFYDYGGAGGILINMGSPTIKNCVIKNNYGDGAGIGVYNNASPKIINCVITENKGYGAIHSYYSTPEIINCTITKNKQGTRGITPDGDSPIVKNSIIWDNDGKEIDGDAEVTYSNIEGGYVGQGNINQNPLLSDDGYHLLRGSPCINSGTNVQLDLDIDGQLRPIGTRFDMGADEADLLVIRTRADSKME